MATSSSAAVSSATPWVLKFVKDDDVRRTTVQTAPTFEVVRDTMQNLHSLSQAEAATFELRYKDDEGDECTLIRETLPDALCLAENSHILRMMVLRCAPVAQSPTAPSSGVAASDATMRDVAAPVAMPPPFQHLMQHLHASMSAGGAVPADVLGSLVMHMLPMLNNHYPSWQADLDRFAGGQPDKTLTILQSLRDGLEPFPQFQQTHVALDRILHTQSLDGLGAVAGEMLRTFHSLPSEQQSDVCAVALNFVVENLPQFALQASPNQVNAAAPVVHHQVVCDGCGVSPLVGARYKCKTCPDYDLCGACYGRKHEIHAQHEFDCHVEGLHSDAWRRTCHGGGWGTKCHHPGWGWYGNPWDSAWGWQGHGKPCRAQGKGRHVSKRGCSSSSSPSSSNTSSTSSCKPGSKHELKKQRKEQKKECKAAKKAAKQVKKDAKKAAKAEKKECKKACKRLRQGCREKPAETDAAMQVEAESVDMTPSAPPAPEVNEADLRTLEEMGFADRELNTQLLLAHKGKVEVVVQHLAWS